MAKLKRAVLIIPEVNYSEEELAKTKSGLQAGGVKVDVACTNIRQAKGNRGGSTIPDKSVADINVADYDAVVFIGGNGSQQYWDDPTAHSIAKEAAASDKVLAAICIAPVTLANAGLLDGKKATVWFSEGQTLTAAGADYTGKPVEVDGSIITANGPTSATEFAKKILEKL